MKQRIMMGTLAVAALSIAGCGGGGGTASSSLPVTSAGIAPASTTRMMDIAFGGTTTLSRTRSTQSLAGTPVVATYNGKTVAGGTLDANGHATLTFTADVPRGATIVVTAGSVSATIVLAQSDDGTSAQVQVNGDGTLTVSAAAEHPGASPSASPAPGAESETIQEDHSGNPIVISTTMNSLPANLPVVITAACGTITIAPASNALPHVLIEMKAKDADNSARFRFEGALTAPLSVPVPAGALRIHIRIFSSGGGTLLDVQGPATSGTAASASTACPSAAPSASAAASAAPSASPSVAPSALPSVAPSASASVAPSASPSASPSPASSATP